MGRHERQSESRLAAGLGWFSLGLGLAELAAPAGIAQLIGLKDDERTRNVLRAYGAREIATGVAILGSGSNDPEWLWARVAGDVLDLASLGASLRRDDAQPGKVAFGLASVAGVMLADIIAARGLGRTEGSVVRGFGQARPDGAIRVSKSFTINAPPGDVHAFWRQLDNFPKFMRHVESVQMMSDRTSHWVARGPAGTRVHWDAEMIEDTPQRISWRSLERADVRNSGTVEFKPAPGGRGTELRVRLEYDPPGGRAGKWFAKLFGEEPEQQLYDDLRRVKSLIETGEIARTAGSSSVFQPAQPFKGGQTTTGDRR